MKQRRVAILIPAWNEGTVIGEVITSTLATTGIETHDMIVVDDGSTDNTADVAEAAGVTVIRHILNSGGAGGPTTTGLAYAKAEGYQYVVTMDADGQHAPADVKKLIDAITEDKYDLIIGSRLIDSTGMLWYRVIGNKGLSFITKVLFGIGVTDSQSGLRALNRKALEQINLKSTGYEFCSEMLWRAKQQNLRVEEIPAQAIYTDYSIAKGQSNWNGFNIVKNLVKRKMLELIDA
ncbi:glycosyltransferase family 2 protein [Candidatus Saccharibacteria bacterium]|nr:glycosyltransferase family 2 protein [Candidatus Saccharibacteria bacterium]